MSTTDYKVWDEVSSFTAGNDFIIPSMSTANMCAKCDSGVVRLAFIKGSKDNYCDCQLGNDLRLATRCIKDIPTALDIVKQKESGVQRCEVLGCGGIIFGVESPSTPYGPAEWDVYCDRCGGFPDD